MGLQLSEHKPLSPFPEREFERYGTDLPARVIIIGHHLQSEETACRLKDISCSGARLRVKPDVAVPNHFFLQIDGFSDEIGCTMVSRTLEYIALKFNMLLADDYLESVLQRNGAAGNAGMH